MFRGGARCCVRRRLAVARTWPGNMWPGARKSRYQQEADQDQRIDDLEQQQAYQPPPQAPPAAAPPAPASSAMIDQLNQLAALHQQGVLTDDEFSAAKAKLFGT